MIREVVVFVVVATVFDESLQWRKTKDIGSGSNKLKMPGEDPGLDTGMIKSRFAVLFGIIPLKVDRKVVQRLISFSR